MVMSWDSLPDGYPYTICTCGEEQSGVRTASLTPMHGYPPYYTTLSLNVSIAIVK